VKNHSWCEGYLYDRLLSPLAAWLVQSIIELVPKNSTVLEIGCGPGVLARRLGTECAKVTAIDISERMIEYAKRKKIGEKVENVEFLCLPVADIMKKINEEYDCAISSFCLHEMDNQQRCEAVHNCLTLSKKMIIADYRAPFPKSATAFGNITMEVLAGKRHHTNFMSWQASGGIDGLIKSMNLKIINQIEWKDRCGKTVVVSR
jgi:SAM-dependent methyltransferase